jgi:hypothetical protein
MLSRRMRTHLVRRVHILADRDEILRRLEVRPARRLMQVGDLLGRLGRRRSGRRPRRPQLCCNLFQEFFIVPELGDGCRTLKLDGRKEIGEFRIVLQAGCVRGNVRQMPTGASGSLRMKRLLCSSSSVATSWLPIRRVCEPQTLACWPRTKRSLHLRVAHEGAHLSHLRLRLWARCELLGKLGSLRSRSVVVLRCLRTLPGAQTTARQHRPGGSRDQHDG